jgi:hypothetical protein
MKIAILSESPADEAAVRILVEAIVGEPVSLAEVRNRRPPGYSGVLKALGVVFRSLYFTPDADGLYADGLVVVVDANGSEIHTQGHDTGSVMCGDCRVCALRELVREERRRLPIVAGRPRLRCAIGLAVPAVEAWLLSAREPGLAEEVWNAARREQPPREPRKRARLKELAYGTTRPTLELATARMTEYAREISKDLPRLRGAFPGGFGAFAAEIESWRGGT